MIISQHKSLVDNDIYDTIDLRKHPTKNFVKGRWALTVKRDNDGKFLKCKARWVLKHFFRASNSWTSKLILPHLPDQDLE